jgi:hypothetical protein
MKCKVNELQEPVFQQRKRRAPSSEPPPKSARKPAPPPTRKHALVALAAEEGSTDSDARLKKRTKLEHSRAVGPESPINELESESSIEEHTGSGGILYYLLQTTCCILTVTRDRVRLGLGERTCEVENAGPIPRIG